MPVNPMLCKLRLSRLVEYAKNEHLIVNTAESEVVNFNSAGEIVPFFNIGGATLFHYIITGMISTGPPEKKNYAGSEKPLPTLIKEKEPIWYLVS
jgi:hypothetical protein